MKRMSDFAKAFWTNEQGLETVEYAIIAGMIVSATIATIASIGLWVSDKFTSVNNALAAH